MDEKRKSSLSTAPLTKECKGSDFMGDAQTSSVKKSQSDPIFEKLYSDAIAAQKRMSVENTLDVKKEDVPLAVAESIWQADFPFVLITKDTEVPPVEFLFFVGTKPFLEIGLLNALTSIGRGNKTGGGKSHTVYVLIAAAMVGRIGCITSSKTGLVMYVEAEMGASRTKECRRKIRQIIEQEGGTFDDSKLLTVTYNADISSSTDKRFAATLSIMEAYKPLLLVFDPLTKLISDEGQGDTLIEVKISELKRVAKKTGTTVIVVAHGTKADDDEHLNGRVGTLLEQDVSTLLTVNHKKECGNDYFEVRTSKNRAEQIEPWRWSFVGDYGNQYPFPYLAQETCGGLSQATIRSYLVDAFKGETELSSGEIVKLLVQINGRGSSSNNEILRQAKAANIIMECSRRNRYIYYRLNDEK